MTPRALWVMVVGFGVAPLGVALGWPELTGIAAVLVLLVLVSVVGWTWCPPASVTLDRRVVSVVRGEPARLLVTVDSQGRRPRLRLSEGSVDDPVRTVPVPSGSEAATVPVPVDTSRRGQWAVGPFTAVRGDPWSFVRRSAGISEVASVIVRPRIYPVRPTVLAQAREASGSATRRRGEDTFFALREYAFGDEPRTVHWRSSARTGQLVVKQYVAEAAEGLLVVLDTDASAYGSGRSFGEAFVADRFERAVEVAASVCAARSQTLERVQFATTARRSPVQTAGASGTPQTLLNALAVVDVVAPVDAAPEELSALIRRTRCTSVIVVSGSPSPVLASAARSALLVRVGESLGSTGRTLDVRSAEDLA